MAATRSAAKAKRPPEKTVKEPKDKVSKPKPSSNSTLQKKNKNQAASTERAADTNPRSKTKSAKVGNDEKRPKPFRGHAPQSFLQKLERAQTQRMIVINRKRSGKGFHLKEDIDVVGTTGNVYTVTIGRLPSCTCPDHCKGNECKHKVYALSTVLKAPYHLQYQRGLLSSEVSQIFSSSPPIPDASGRTDDQDGKRKAIEGECPICYMDLEPSNNEIVWCKAACGNNLHKECFDRWAKSQKSLEIRCVYCRTPWQVDVDDAKGLIKNGVRTDEGYINVADQVGISRTRDYSGYHQPWVRRNFGYR